MNRSFIAILPAFLILGVATLAAYPRLSVEHSEPCKNCHFSPAGGGARTEYGNFATGLNELTLPSTKRWFASRYRKPRVGESVIVGFDLRYLALDDGRFFRMQTDGFVTLEPIKEMYYHMRIGDQGVTENYALLTLSDNTYSARIGTFTPSVGLHVEDHTAFIRERAGNGPEVYLDGLSLAAEVSGVNMIAEVFSPGEQAMVDFSAYRPGSFGPFGYLAGGSYRLTEEIGPDDFGLYPHLKSLYGGLAYDRLTALGEMEMIGKGNDQIAAYASLTGRIEYGLYLTAEYNFFDPNRRLETGVEEFWRFSVDFYPIPFLEIRPSYTTYTEGALDGTDQFFLQFHMGY